jgi:NADH:ubiquinone oxidoreductase subunit 6 (subunit J)
MGAWLYGLLALGITCLAAVAVSLRSPRGALLALAGTLLGLAAVAVSQALSLVALAWAAAAVGTAVGAAVAALTLPTPAQPITDAGQEQQPRKTTAIAVVGLWLIVGGAVLLAADSPIWHEPARRFLAAPSDWVGCGLLLATRYAPGLVAVALLVLTLLVGQRLGKEAD